MPSQHDQLFSQVGVTQETEYFGEPIELSPAEGDPFTVEAVVVRADDTLDAAGDGRAVARKALVKVPVAAMSATSDKLRAAFDGCAWDLRPLNTAAPDGWWRFDATRREVLERTHPGYRGMRS